MTHNRHIILFDGVCNLCNRSIDFILRRDKKEQFRFVALQSDEGKKLVRQFNIPAETDSVLLIKNDLVFTESDAALEISKMLPFPWKWANVFRVLPLKFRNSIYHWIARNRYRWFGKRTSCRVIKN